MPKTPVTLSSRGSAADVFNSNAADFCDTETTNKRMRLGKTTFERDGGMCVVTNILDVKEAAKLSQALSKSILSGRTVGANILPLTLGGEREAGAREQAWKALYRYFPSICTAVDNYQVNKICNILTMCTIVHEAFSSFKLALEPDEQNEHVYYVRTYLGFSTILKRDLPMNGLVSFTAYDRRHEMPNRHLLRLHAAVAKVLHLSGVGEEIEEIMRDRDSICQRASDGSTDVAKDSNGYMTVAKDWRWI